MRKKIAIIRLISLFSGIYFWLFTGITAYANPQGPQVVHGQAGFSNPNQNTLHVTNSPNAIINWKGFSIQQHEVTRFIQQSGNSAVLNRVTGGNPSNLLGQLLSNGKVFLINPNGMVFGPNCVIDTAGFVASTLNITDQDFLRGNLKFEGGSDSGSIINQGYITAGKNGGIYLIAPNIENSGIIHTEGGNLLLAAGESITITSLDLKDVHFEIQSPDNEVLNLGKVLADGGAVNVFAGTLKHSGEIRADTISVDETGTIILTACNDITLEAGSLMTANGPQGGTVSVESQNGTTLVSGIVEATGSEGNGGKVRLLGERVGLIDSALVDASGESGGGEILIGGDYQGKNPDIINAMRTGVAPNTVINADALSAGDGGKVVVWADDTTNFYGNISARGGISSGDGGFVEVSGKKALGFHGEVDTTAFNGSKGTLLLDPAVINLRGGTGDGSSDGNNVFNGGTNQGEILFADALNDVYESEIEGQSATTNIVLEATTNILALGDFTDDSVTLAPDSNLTIRTRNQAGEAGQINLTTSADGVNLEFKTQGTGTITLNGSTDGGAEGNIYVGKIVSDSGDISISSNHGYIVLNNTVTSAGGAVDVSTSLGNITVDGILTSGSNIILTARNININNTINSTAGNLTLVPDAGYAVNLNADLNTAGDIDATGGSGEVNLLGPSTVNAPNFDAGTLNISTGTVIMNPLTTVDSLNLSGGALAGSGDLIVNGTANWTGGTLTGTGAPKATFNGGLSISSASDKFLYVRTIENNDTITWIEGRIVAGTGPVINNNSGASFEIQGNNFLDYSNSGSIPVINNNGSFLKTTSTGTASLEAVFNNTGASGTVSISAGSLQLRNGGTSTRPISVTGTYLDINAGSYDFDAGATLTGSGEIRISNTGTLNINTSLTTPTSLTINNGTLSGTGDITVSGPFEWQGGSVSVAGGLTTTGATNLSSVSAKTLDGVTWTNNGTVTQTGGQLIINPGGEFINAPGGVLDLQVDVPITTEIGGTGLLTNSGTIQRTGVANTALLSAVVDTDNGTFSATTGALQLEGGGTHTGTLDISTGTVYLEGSHTLAAGLNITGGGELVVNSDTTTMGGNVTVGGTLKVNAGTLDLPHDLIVNPGGIFDLAGGTLNSTGGDWNSSAPGTIVWSGGVIAGNLTNDLAITMSGTASKTINDTFTNNGTVTQTGGQLIINPGGEFINAPGGVLDLQVDVPITTEIGGTGLLTNSGTIQRTGVANTALLSAVVDTDNGTFSATTGALQLEGGGTHTGTLDISTGTVYLEGSHTLAAGLNITGGGELVVNSDTTTMGGNVTVGGTLRVNAGTMDLAANTLNIDGTMIVTGGALSGIGPVTVNLGGILDINTMITIPGSIEVAGGILNLDDDLGMSGNLFLSSGTVQGPGDLTLDNLFDWSGGSLAGTGAITIGATGILQSSGTQVCNQELNNQGTIDVISGELELNGDGTHGSNFDVSSATEILRFNNGTHTFSGFCDFTGSGRVELSGGAVFAGAGTITNNVIFVIETDTTISPTFINSYVLQKTAGPGTTTFTSPFENSGTLSVNSGTLDFPAGYTQTFAGLLTYLNGGNLAGDITINSGSLQGAGTISGNVINSSLIAPGNSPEKLVITGDLTLNPSSVIEIELEGSDPLPPEFDIIEVGGTANLDGTLDVTLPGPFDPAALDTFEIITCGVARVGTFSVETPPAGKNMTVNYNPADVTLSDILDIGGTNEWIFAGDGDWDVAGNWTLGVPLFSQDVEIDLGTWIITIPASYAAEADTLLVGADNTLSLLAGSTLDIGTSATIDGDLTITGGEFRVTGGDAAINGLLTLQGGPGSTEFAELTANNITINGPALQVTGGAGNGSYASVRSTVGDLTINVTSGITVQGGTATGSDAYLQAQTGMDIDAAFVEVFGDVGDAFIDTNSGMQTIDTTGQNPSNFGILVEAVGTGLAAIHSDGTQTINVSNADCMKVVGTVGNADISSNGAQTITVTGTGLNAIEVGNTTAAGNSLIRGNQTITAGTGTQSGSITLQAGNTDNADAIIEGIGAGQTISATGTIDILGGTPASFNQAAFQASGDQSVTASGNIRVESGDGVTAIAEITGNNQVIQSTGGNILVIGGDGTNGSDARIDNNSGDQTLTAAGQIHVLSGPTDPARINNLDAGGTQYVNAQSILVETTTDAGDSTHAPDASINSDGAQDITTSEGIVVRNLPTLSNAQATIKSQNGQIIDAGFIEIIENTGDDTLFTAAFIENNGGDQEITTTDTNAAGEGIRVESLGVGLAFLGCYNGGSQTIVVTDADYLRVLGTGSEGFVKIISEGTQQISLTGSGLNAIEVLAFGSDAEIAGNQTITAGDPGESGSLTVQAGSADGADAHIKNNNALATQTINVQGNISVLGGTSSNGTNSSINSDGGQTVDATDIEIIGGSSGTNNVADIKNFGGAQVVDAGNSIRLETFAGSSDSFANIRTDGTATSQTVTADAGGITLIAGPGDDNHAIILQDVTGATQTVTITGGGDLFAQGADGGTDNDAGVVSNGAQSIDVSNGIWLESLAGSTQCDAHIRARGTAGFQTITVGAGGITLIAGAGDNSNAVIQQEVSGSPQTVTINDGGDLFIQAGDGGDDNDAWLWSQGDQVVTVSNGIWLESRAGGSENQANIRARDASTVQTITAGADGLTVIAGAGDNNDAGIMQEVTGAQQTIDIGGDLLVQAADGGDDNDAQIRSADGTQTISANGLTVSGGDGGIYNDASINAGDSQDITAGAGGILVQAGNSTVDQAGSGNYAGIFLNPGATGSQTIVVNGGGDITVLAGNGVADDWAAINSNGTGNTVTLNGGGDLVVSGGSSDKVDFHADAELYSPNDLTVNVSGDLNFSGGTGNESQAVLFSIDNLQVTVDGSVNLTGGTGNITDAAIESDNNVLVTVTGGNVNLQGGAGNDSWAGISADGSLVLDVTSGNLTITGGGGFDGSGSVGGESDVDVNVGGNLSLTGGTGQDASAAIGTEGIGTPTINVDVAGNLQISGGNGQGPAAIGSIEQSVVINIGNAAPIGGDISISGGTGSDSIAVVGALGAGHDADVTIETNGSFTMNAGTGGTLIGSELAGGLVDIKAGLGGAGGIALNNGTIHVDDDVMLQATAPGGTITQNAAGIINIGTNTLTADADGDIILLGTNTMGEFVPSSANGNVDYQHQGALSIDSPIGGVSGDMTFRATGGITQTAPVTNVNSLNLFSGGVINMDNAGNSVTVLNATDSSGTGIIFQNNGDLNVGLLDAGPGTVTLKVTGAGNSLTDANGGATNVIGASGVTLEAPVNIGTLGDPLEIQTTSLTLQGTHTGEVAVANTGNLAFGGGAGMSDLLLTTTGTLNLTGPIGGGTENLDLRGNGFTVDQNITGAFVNLSGGSGTHDINGVHVQGTYLELSGSNINVRNNSGADPVGASGDVYVHGGSLTVDSGTLESGADMTLQTSNVTLKANGSNNSMVYAGGDMAVSTGSLKVLGSSVSASLSSKLEASGNMDITADSVTVQGGNLSNTFASIDPYILVMNVSGDVNVLGGAGDGSYAEISGEIVEITAGPTLDAGNINITGGTGNNAGAWIGSTCGDITLIAGDILFPADINLMGGAGVNSDSLIDAAGGAFDVYLTFHNGVGLTLLPGLSAATDVGILAMCLCLDSYDPFYQPPVDPISDIVSSQGQMDELLDEIMDTPGDPVLTGDGTGDEEEDEEKKRGRLICK